MNDDADIVDDVDANNCIEGLLEEDDDVIDIKFTGIIGVPLLILLLVRASVVIIGSTGTSCIGTDTDTGTDTGTCIQDIATSKVLHSNKRGIQQKMETLLTLTIIALVVCFIILCVVVRVVPTLTSEWIFRRILLQSMMISATCSS